MNRDSYMSKGQMIEWLFVASMAGQCAELANNTPDKSWRQKLKACATHLGKITDERLACLAPDQLMSVVRRRQTCGVILQYDDQKRAATGKKETVEADLNDLETMAELALYSCTRECIQGDCVSECQFRKAFHRLGIEPARENVTDGQCEFVTEGGK